MAGLPDPCLCKRTEAKTLPIVGTGAIADSALEELGAVALVAAAREPDRGALRRAEGRRRECAAGFCRCKQRRRNPLPLFRIYRCDE